jgi:proteasome lid subunit RPN8/RPN11
MTLVLSAGLREAIVEHALEGAPEEVVGVLAGERSAGASEATTETGERSVAERRYPAENAAATPETRYEIAPADELALLERAEDAGLDVVGFYHSHPRGPLAPSETDARLAAWPGRSYVIVSLADDPELGSWRWTGEAFEREPLVVG